MAAYEYIALDAGGRQKKGVIEADSGRQIRQILRDQELVPLSVDTATERATTSSNRRFRWRRGMSGLDIWRVNSARSSPDIPRRYRSKRRCGPLRNKPKKVTSARW